MVTKTSQGGHTAYNIQTFVLDDASDLENLPITGVPAGSTAFIIATSKNYMMNSKGEWKEIQI